MFFGAPVWPCKWHPPYDDAIKRIASLGFQGVELIAWSSDILRDYYTPATIKGLKSLIADSGLTVTNFYHGPPQLGSSDSALLASAISDYERAIDVAAELGSPNMAGTAPYPFAIDVPHMLTRPTTQEWIVPIGRDLDWTKNYDNYVESMTRLCATAAKAGLGVAIEPHPFRWVNSAQSMLRLIERTGASNLGLNLDPSHLFPSGDIPHYTVYLLGSKILHTHFSDNDGQTNAHWRPGKGKVDWAAVMRALKDVGYTGVISFELEDVPGSGKRHQDSTPALDAELKKSIDYLTTIMGEEGISTRQ